MAESGGRFLLQANNPPKDGWQHNSYVEQLSNASFIEAECDGSRTAEAIFLDFSSSSHLEHPSHHTQLSIEGSR
jgi:hypothetical protein